MEKKCPCGNKLPTQTERKKYCSKKCFYKFRVRPSGLKYVLVKENPTTFKKGQKPWNAGLAGKGICKPTKGSIKKGERRGKATEFSIETSAGENNVKWKGDDVGYHALHGWVSRNKERTQKCKHCGAKGRTHFANISYDYKRDVTDWIELCQSCHHKFDKKLWGKTRKKFAASLALEDL